MIDMSHTYDWLALIEKRLRPHEQKQAEAHLAVCAPCRAQVIELTRLASDLKAMARVSLPVNQAAWPALWTRVQRPAVRPYPTRQLAACLSVIIACLIFSNAWVARLAGGQPLTKGVDQPRTHIIVETPQPPGSVAALRGEEAGTPATQPIEPNSANANAAPRAVPIATPVPGPTS